MLLDLGNLFPSGLLVGIEAQFRLELLESTHHVPLQFQHQASSKVYSRRIGIQSLHSLQSRPSLVKVALLELRET